MNYYEDLDESKKEQFIYEAQATVIKEDDYWLIVTLNWKGNTYGSFVKNYWWEVQCFIDYRIRYIKKNKVWKHVKLQEKM